MHANLINPCLKTIGTENRCYLWITIEKTQRSASGRCLLDMLMPEGRLGVILVIRNSLPSALNLNIWFISTGLYKTKEAFKGYNVYVYIVYIVFVYIVSFRPDFPQEPGNPRC